MLGLAACDVHQFPEDMATFGEVETVHIVLTYPEGEMPIYTETTYSRASTEQTDYEVRYLAYIYPRTSGSQYSSTPDTVVTFTRRNFDLPDAGFSVDLPAGDYRVVAWTDFVDRNTGEDKFYDTTDFPEIYLNTAVDHEGNNDFRDCYRGKREITIQETDGTGEDQEFIVEMRRPVGKFIVYATDVDQIDDLGEASAAAAVRAGNYYTVISYSGFMPCAYQLVNDFNSDSKGGTNFSTLAMMNSEENNNEVYLGGDYVFTNTGGGSVSIAVAVYNRSSGALVAQTDPFTVPMMQGQLTIVRGAFFTATGGGVGVDPSFDDPDYNLVIP